ncbi:MAG: cytidine deaminase [Melioribacteraceae bacterium]|nr:cytidine deaminase [Melioribacteraceae bacterium]MCO6473594.1 cytidine deaminase [Melioribacteraceae bacterium]MDD3557947.1 cytidine deaminase [Melioribacteraceae bacterium]
MEYENLLKLAKEATAKSISPYSNFKVGAALETNDGKIYKGANIESSSYSLTICAERTALFTALIEGEKHFKSIAVVSSSEDYCPPCGACRQVLLDFCGPDLEVVLNNSKNELKVIKLSELIPFSFNGDYLNK